MSGRKQQNMYKTKLIEEQRQPVYRIRGKRTKRSYHFFFKMTRKEKEQKLKELLVSFMCIITAILKVPCFMLPSAKQTTSCTSCSNSSECFIQSQLPVCKTGKVLFNWLQVKGIKRVRQKFSRWTLAVEF